MRIKDMSSHGQKAHRMLGKIRRGLEETLDDGSHLFATFENPAPEWMIRWAAVPGNPIIPELEWCTDREFMQFSLMCDLHRLELVLDELQQQVLAS